MAFNINTFRSNGLQWGGARPTLFDVEITFPTSLNLTGTTENKIKFLVNASQIPPAQLGTVEVNYFGRPIKFSGDRTFPDWSVTVMNDEDFDLRAAFEQWSNMMNTMVSNVNEGSYKTTAIVNQYAKGGKSDKNGADTTPIRSYKFEGIFPTNIGPIQLSWDATNRIETFDVNFAYDWWEPLDGNGSLALPQPDGSKALKSPLNNTTRS